MNWRTKLVLGVTALALLCGTTCFVPFRCPNYWVTDDGVEAPPHAAPPTILPIWEINSGGVVLEDEHPPVTPLEFGAIPPSRVSLGLRTTIDVWRLAIHVAVILGLGGGLALFIEQRERWKRGRRDQPVA